MDAQPNYNVESLAEILGFVIEFDTGVPWLRWVGQEGALTGKGRPALEAEVRMWKVLVGEKYDHWATRAMPASSMARALMASRAIQLHEEFRANHPAARRAAVRLRLVE